MKTHSDRRNDWVVSLASSDWRGPATWWSDRRTRRTRGQYLRIESTTIYTTYSLLSRPPCYRLTFYLLFIITPNESKCIRVEPRSDASTGWVGSGHEWDRIGSGHEIFQHEWVGFQEFLINMQFMRSLKKLLLIV